MVESVRSEYLKSEGIKRTTIADDKCTNLESDHSFAIKYVKTDNNSPNKIDGINDAKKVLPKTKSEILIITDVSGIQ